MSSLAVGVVGVGHMGRRHVEKVAALSAAGEPLRLAGVFDPDAERARRAVEGLGAPVLPDLASLLQRADALVVAVPTTAHHAVVARALASGCDVLVEKPIATTVAEAEDLIARARERRCVLQVGHLDWFNPATRVLRRRVCAPRFVQVRRVGPFAHRATDVDVVRDLMIHDLDILQRLLGEEPERIDALGIRVVTECIDVANARLVFPSGCVADLTASRVAVDARRQMRFFQRDGCFAVDFLARSASLIPAADAGAASRVEQQSAVFEAEDALLAQLRAFVGEIGKRAAPLASACTAAVALRTAQRVIAAMPPD
ncbi:MAG: Gfo/Idh/MocA family oxidoreductase [Deltaproteobacteria bacterium]|nr:Gfo/Idh/MocA family oxidoreductase [Deltaproteobacteria bacterium]